MMKHLTLALLLLTATAQAAVIQLYPDATVSNTWVAGGLADIDEIHADYDNDFLSHEVSSEVAEFTFSDIPDTASFTLDSVMFASRGKEGEIGTRILRVNVDTGNGYGANFDVTVSGTAMSWDSIKITEAATKTAVQAIKVKIQVTANTFTLFSLGRIVLNVYGSFTPAAPTLSWVSTPFPDTIRGLTVQHTGLQVDPGTADVDTVYFQQASADNGTWITRWCNSYQFRQSLRDPSGTVTYTMQWVSPNYNDTTSVRAIAVDRAGNADTLVSWIRVDSSRWSSVTADSATWLKSNDTVNSLGGFTYGRISQNDEQGGAASNIHNRMLVKILGITLPSGDSLDYILRANQNSGGAIYPFTPVLLSKTTTDWYNGAAVASRDTNTANWLSAKIGTTHWTTAGGDYGAVNDTGVIGDSAGNRTKSQFIPIARMISGDSAVFLIRSPAITRTTSGYWALDDEGGASPMELLISYVPSAVTTKPQVIIIQ